MAASVAHVFHQFQRWTSGPPTEEATDAALLGRFVRQRDEAAFAALVARHGAMVLGVCRRVLGDVHAAEDAFQAAFLILARKARSLNKPESLPGWLHGVARRVALKARARSAGRPSAEALFGDALPDRHPDPLSQLTARELLDVLDEEVQRLPAGQRSAVVLCCLEGHTQEEAAQMLSRTPGSVKGRLERGRRRLQERLARRGVALSAALAVVAVSRGVAAPALLQKSAVAAALGGGIGSQAAALAEGVLKATGLRKLAAVSAIVTSIALAASATVALACRGSMAESSQETTPPVSASRERGAGKGKPEPPRDALGDPLPDGAIARLGTVRFRHGQPITSLAFTPDGKRLVSQGNDGVRVWESVSGKHLRDLAPDGETFGGPPDLSPDGMQLAGVPGGHDKLLRLWDADTGRLLDTLEAKYPLRVRFSPDGKLLAVAANYPGGVELWDTATRKKVRGWQASPPQYVEHLVFSADARRLLTADGD